MAKRVPVTVIGGYLGAGKTTLVNHLLRNAAGRRLAILVNDFGDLPIDADLIEAQSDDLISIAGGCVCCSFGSDLMGALMKIVERRPAPEHVLLETSGVALPGSVARSVALIAGLSVDGVVVLADAETVRARADDRYMGDTITRQLAEADLVVLNKTDLVDEAVNKTLCEWLVKSAPQARVVEAVRGEVPIEVLLGKRELAAGRLFESGSIRAAPDTASTYASASFEVPAPVDVEKFARSLADPSCGLLRAKGVLRDRAGLLKTLHVVGTRSEVTPHAGESTTGIACIGLRALLDRAAIERALAEATTDILLSNP